MNNRVKREVLTYQPNPPTYQHFEPSTYANQSTQPWLQGIDPTNAGPLQSVAGSSHMAISQQPQYSQPYAALIPTNVTPSGRTQNVPLSLYQPERVSNGQQLPGQSMLGQRAYGESAYRPPSHIQPPLGQQSRQEPTVLALPEDMPTQYEQSHDGLVIDFKDAGCTVSTYHTIVLIV
jgi:hypothetical protein